uniref:Histone H2A/H2B/H3 domain-containing protein n=1 Tax=Panagrolaimus sp. JU765 TaxID=591449 RepID=A0AC34R1K2_9BILA
MPRSTRIAEETCNVDSNNVCQRLPHSTMNPLRSATPAVKPHWYRPGEIARRKIRRHRNSNNLVIDEWVFQHLVKEIALSLGTKCRFQSAAIETLQEASEAYIIGLFEKRKFVCQSRQTYHNHAKRSSTCPQNSWRTLIAVRNVRNSVLFCLPFPQCSALALFNRVFCDT